MRFSSLRSALPSTGERHRIFSWQVAFLSLVTGILNALYWSVRNNPDDWSSLWIAGLLVRRGETGQLYDYDSVDFAAWAGPAWGEIVHFRSSLSSSPSLCPYPRGRLCCRPISGGLRPLSGVATVAFDDR